MYTVEVSTAECEEVYTTELARGNTPTCTAEYVGVSTAECVGVYTAECVGVCTGVCLEHVYW